MFQKIMLGIVALASAQALSSTAVAQTTGEWPERSVTMYVGFAPGGANSNVTRILADQLTKRLGQQFVVEHLPGAGGRVAASTVAGKPADGYTFFTGAPGVLVLSHLLFNNVPYSMEDFAPVSEIGILPYILLVNNDLPVESAPELIDYLMEHPGEVNHGATGTGPTFVQELLKYRTGTEFENLMYKGTAPAIQDLMRGDIQFMFDLIPGVTAQVGAKQVKALAVSSPVRSQAYPDLPTLEQAGVADIDATNWYGIVAPAGTPQEIIDKMSEEIQAIVQDPKIADQLITMGVEPTGSTPEEFGKFISMEQQRWAEVAKAAKIEKQ